MQTRIVAEPPGPAGRAALADAALRAAVAGNRSVTLDDHGEALVVTASDADPTIARLAARSMADTLLNMPQPGLDDQAQAASPAVGQSPGQGSRITLSADRDRLQAALEATDARLSTISASLTGVVRDLAANAHATTERKPGQDTLAKAETALADLQLQRIQLQSRYQDDYPAMVALDGQIRSLRGFMQDEMRRVGVGVSHASTEPADAGLTAERDRLRTELTQVADRRAAIATDLAGATRLLAQAPPQQSSAPRPVSAAARALPPATVLIEGATMVTSGPDVRWLVALMIAAAGSLLSLVTWLKPGRRFQPDPADLLLQRLEALLLPPHPATALPEGDSLPKLSREQPAFDLRVAG